MPKSWAERDWSMDIHKVARIGMMLPPLCLMCGWYSMFMMMAKKLNFSLTGSTADFRLIVFFAPDLTVLQYFSDVFLCPQGRFCQRTDWPKIGLSTYTVGKFILQPLDYTQVIPTLLMVWLLKLKRVNTYAKFGFSYISITFMLIRDKQHIKATLIQCCKTIIYEFSREINTSYR